MRSPAPLALALEHLIGLLRVPPFVLQVGAFDGRTGDPLHDHIVAGGWPGVLVEPQSGPFAELQRTYATQPQITLRNVAIGPRTETRMLYVPESNVAWAPQSASFDRKLAQRCGNVESVPVSCVTFDELLENIDRVDLLQIDAEGYDAELLDLFPFDRYRPSIVSFEATHLSRRAHKRAIACLVSHGYRVAPSRWDTLGWRE